MSKRIKRAALNSAPYGVYEDPKAMNKHQALFQDYEELQKEVETIRDNFDAMKKKKLTLSAEVRFLRQRYRFLVKNKALNTSQERELVQQQDFGTHHRKSTKDWVYGTKEIALRSASPLFDLDQKGRSKPLKEATTRNATHNQTRHRLDSNQRGRNYKGKEAATQNSVPMERIHGGKDATLRCTTPMLDLNQDNTHGQKEAASQSRALVFDLNQISREEEEFENSFQPLRMEEQKKGLIGGAGDEQLNEFKLSVCRNLGDSSSRVGKRKISWQDPVALRV